MKNIIYIVYDQRAEIMDLEDCICMYMDEDINEARKYAEQNNGVLFEAEYEIKNGQRKIIKEKLIDKMDAEARQGV